jgi:hypothetical protein
MNKEENKGFDAVHEIYEKFGMNFIGNVVRAHSSGVTFETVYNHELMGRAKKLCVCSSGPSLERDIELVRKANDEGYVIVCGTTSVGFLFRQHIIPHVVVCHDAGEATFEAVAEFEKMIERDDAIRRKMVLYVSAFADNRFCLVSRFKGVKKFFYVPLVPSFQKTVGLISFLAGAVGSLFKGEIGFVDSDGDTTNVMLNLCFSVMGRRKEKFNMVLLTFGCDYGWQKDGKQRVDMFKWNPNNGFEVVSSRPKMEGFEVSPWFMTTKVLDICRGAFFARIAAIKGQVTGAGGRFLWANDQVKAK